MKNMTNKQKAPDRKNNIKLLAEGELENNNIKGGIEKIIY